MMRIFCAVAVIILASDGVDAAPLEAYANLPLYEEVALSPDGKQIAFISTVGDKREAVIQPLSADGVGRRIKVGSQKLRSLRWIGSEHLLFTTSTSTSFIAGPQMELGGFSSYDLRRQGIFTPTTWNKTGFTPEAADSPAEPSRFMNLRFITGSDRHSSAFYRVDFEQQKLTLLEASPLPDWKKSYAWFADANGKLVAQTIYDEEAKRWSLELRRNGKWEQVQSEQALIETPYIIGLGPEADTIIINRIEDGERVPRRLSLSSGKWGEALPEEWRGARYIYDPQRKPYVIGVEKLEARRRYVFFDEKTQREWNQVVNSFPGEEVQLVDWTADRSKVVVRVFGIRTGAGYVMVDQTKRQFSFLGNLYAGIGPEDINSVRPIRYDAADGIPINGYLTLPKGKETKNLPLIVVPHGGPAAQNVLQFDWLAQALASRGYLVLQPNFRGSTNLDRKFEEAGYREWGRKMQTDLSDGVRALVKLGVVDPKKVCIVGSSYGGYAALAAAVQESDVYRCAVSTAGISDLKSQFQGRVDVRITDDNQSLRFDLRYLGAANLDDPVLVDRSPAAHADRVNIPVMLIHGDNDSVVPFEQSQIMANALKKAGKNYELVKLKAEDHWLSRAETRLQMLRAVVNFLGVNNPP